MRAARRTPLPIGYAIAEGRAAASAGRPFYAFTLMHGRTPIGATLYAPSAAWRRTAHARLTEAALQHAAGAR